MQWEQRFINCHLDTNQIHLYLWFVHHRGIVKHTYANGRNCICRFSCD